MNFVVGFQKHQPGIDPVNYSQLAVIKTGCGRFAANLESQRPLSLSRDADNNGNNNHCQLRSILK